MSHVQAGDRQRHDGLEPPRSAPSGLGGSPCAPARVRRPCSAPHSSSAGSPVAAGHRSCCLASSEVVACAPVEQLVPVCESGVPGAGHNQSQRIGSRCLPLDHWSAARRLSHVASNGRRGAPSSVDRRCLILLREGHEVSCRSPMFDAPVVTRVVRMRIVGRSRAGSTACQLPVRSATTIDRLIRSREGRVPRRHQATTSPHTPTTSCRSKSPANTASSTNRRAAPVVEQIERPLHRGVQGSVATRTAGPARKSRRRSST